MSTIVAPSTPPGRGALSVVRLSGPDSLTIMRTLTRQRNDFKPRVATLARIRYPQGDDVLDEVIVTFFEAPHSLTGEDVIEISCHGSPAVVRQIVEMSLLAGARLAGPGEFTLRALTNGKLNLAQAEAIRDLISAQTEAAVRQAARQLGGELSHALEPFKKDLIDVIVSLESAIEFVEDDLPAVQLQSVQTKLRTISIGVGKLSASYRAGHLLRDGIQVAITGKPNVGKSSLFNALVARERAIVTSLPGTTRDTLSEAIDLGGVPVVLTDTAGMRETTDHIESMGIARAHRALCDADLVLALVDGSSEITEEDRLVLSRNRENTLVVINKCDLPSASADLVTQFSGAVRVSARTGEGLDTLRSAIIHSFHSPELASGGLLVTNARHYDLLRRTEREVDASTAAIGEGRSEELVLVSLHNALRYLGEITGETTAEDILSGIFSTFCIGK